MPERADSRVAVNSGERGRGCTTVLAFGVHRDSWRASQDSRSATSAVKRYPAAHNRSMLLKLWLQTKQWARLLRRRASRGIGSRGSKSVRLEVSTAVRCGRGPRWWRPWGVYCAAGTAARAARAGMASDASRGAFSARTYLPYEMAGSLYSAGRGAYEAGTREGGATWQDAVAIGGGLLGARASLGGLAQAGAAGRLGRTYLGAEKMFLTGTPNLKVGPRRRRLCRRHARPISKDRGYTSI